MEWAQFIIMFVGMVGLFAWNRTESRADTRHMQEQIRANSELIREVHNEIHLEMKDFHGRLEKQDAEFKGKLALQDAEFKSHMLHFHQQKTSG